MTETLDGHHAQDIYDRGCLWLFGYLGETDSHPYFTSTMVAEALSRHGHRPLTVYLNSDGGSVSEAVAIFSSLSAHPCPLKVIVDRRAGGAAALVAMAGTELHARHDAHLYFGCYCACLGSTARERSQYAELLEVRLAERMGQSIENVRELLGQRWRFTAEEAVSAGLAHTALSRNDEQTAVIAEGLRESLKILSPALTLRIRGTRPT